MTNELSVQVEGTSISMSNSGDSSIGSWGNRGGSIGGMGNWGSGNSWSGIGSMSNNSLGAKVLSTGSGNGGLINCNKIKINCKE